MQITPFIHLSKELLGFAPDGWRQSEIDFYFPSSDALCPSRTQLARRQPKTKASSWKEREFRGERQRGFRWMAIFSNATSFSALAPHRWRVRAQGLSHSARGSDTIQVPATKHYWSQIESLARNKIDLIHTSTRECTRFTPFRIRCVADSCGWQENAVAPSCHHVPTDKKDTHNEDLIGQVL